MKTAIFIRSYWKDIPWLEYALASIKKYGEGFEYTIIIIPTKDYKLFKPMSSDNVKLHCFDEVVGKGMIHGQAMLCHAEIICPEIDNFLFTDSDCMFTEPFTPEDYLVDGKPVMVGISFKALLEISPTDKIAYDNGQAIVRQWGPCVRNALGIEPIYECMTRHPCIYKRNIFKPFRDAVEKYTGKGFVEYVLSCRNEYPQTFAEFTTIGNFVLQNFKEEYYFHEKDVTIPVKTDSGSDILRNKLRQFWSHSGIRHVDRVEMEKILNA